MIEHGVKIDADTLKLLSLAYTNPTKEQWQAIARGATLQDDGTLEWPRDQLRVIEGGGGDARADADRAHQQPQLLALAKLAHARRAHRALAFALEPCSPNVMVSSSSETPLPFPKTPLPPDETPFPSQRSALLIRSRPARPRLAQALCVDVLKLRRPVLGERRSGSEIVRNPSLKSDRNRRRLAALRWAEIRNNAVEAD
jgi:hypothetical protein